MRWVDDRVLLPYAREVYLVYLTYIYCPRGASC